MTDTITPDAIRRIAKLARLRVDDADIPTLQRELGGILDWVRQLEEVDVDGVPPMTGMAHMAAPMRDDRVTDGGDAERVLGNAPDRAGAFYAVPKVVE